MESIRDDAIGVLYFGGRFVTSAEYSITVSLSSLNSQSIPYDTHFATDLGLILSLA